MVCKEGVGGGPREAIPGGIMGGRRARVFTKCSQRAVEGGGERSRGLGNQEGHRVLEITQAHIHIHTHAFTSCEEL